MKHIAPTEYPEQYVMCVIRIASGGIGSAAYYVPEANCWTNGLGDIVANGDETVQWMEIDQACRILFDVLY